MKIYKIGIQWSPTIPTPGNSDTLYLAIDFYQDDEWLSYLDLIYLDMPPGFPVGYQFVLATFDPPMECNRLRILSGGTRYRHNILVNDRVVGQIDVNYDAPASNQDYFDLKEISIVPLALIGGAIIGVALLAKRGKT